MADEVRRLSAPENGRCDKVQLELVPAANLTANFTGNFLPNSPKPIKFAVKFRRMAVMGQALLVRLAIPWTEQHAAGSCCDEPHWHCSWS